MTSASFSDLQGLTLHSILARGDDELVFDTTGGVFLMHHEQDCCEGVRIEQVDGDPLDLQGAFLTVAEESMPDLPPAEDSDESYTWTFYRLCTPKGDLTIRWFGSSNGYYSESVDFRRIEAAPPGAVPWNPKEGR